MKDDLTGLLNFLDLGLAQRPQHLFIQE
jgi:hypothetical protein